MTNSDSGPGTVFGLLRAAQLPARAVAAGFDAPITHLSVDSRSVGENSLFIALRGSACDGHAYVEQALRDGAAAAVVEAGVYTGTDPRVVFVPDTHLAVARLAAAHYGLERVQHEGGLTLIGVTGTNGKTTVCTLIRSLLVAAGHRVASLGTIVNDLGDGIDETATMTTLPPIDLCDRLARAIRHGATHAVIEVSSHALDQKRTDGLRFAAGVFTNLSHDHLDYHKTFERYRVAKKRLFDGLDTSAVAVINADDPNSSSLVSECAARVAPYRLADAQLHQLGLTGSEFTTDYEDTTIRLASRLLGRHNVSNLLAAIRLGAKLGIAADAVVAGLAAVTHVPGRLEPVDTDGGPRVFVDYAHTPDALCNVLDLLRATHSGRIHCVFGCGGDRDRAKRSAMGAAVAARADVAWVTSDNPRTEDPLAIMRDIVTGLDRVAQTRGTTPLTWHVEVDRRRAIAEAIASARSDDLVLIAGKGHEDYQIVGNERRQFDDRVVAAEVLAAHGWAA